MISEGQKRYNERYIKHIHYRYQWARGLSRKEIEKGCKERGFNENTLEVILSLNRWDLIDNNQLIKTNKS